MMGNKVGGILAVLLVFFVGLGYGQVGVVAPALEVPAGSKLLLHVYGRGVQVYRCQVLAADTTKYAWILLEAKADLYSGADYSKRTGKHFFNAAHRPVWETTDGASVEGTKLAQVDAPGPPASIPWLLLKASSGAGPLASVTFVKRINTKGGVAPVSGADAHHKDATIEIAYSAEYLFYGN